ncbi:hypothetical protein PsYK624_052560 [Phanerochaete sordida]|uniref:Uncharacterized protein n=1 Tax=Phanerochaete sordida TaxID=48140 RepID=A0A9P3G6K9_9APHY|nr:hypothetical protein PsYK624_052560 [Phanerochaete sordida]
MTRAFELSSVPAISVQAYAAISTDSRWYLRADRDRLEYSRPRWQRNQVIILLDNAEAFRTSRTGPRTPIDIAEWTDLHPPSSGRSCTRNGSSVCVNHSIRIASVSRNRGSSSRRRIIPHTVRTRLVFQQFRGRTRAGPPAVSECAKALLRDQGLQSHTGVANCLVPTLQKTKWSGVVRLIGTILTSRTHDWLWTSRDKSRDTLRPEG